MNSTRAVYDPIICAGLSLFPFVIRCVLRARSPRFLPRNAVPRGVILLLEVKLKHDATPAQKKNLRKFYSERESEDFLPSRFLAASLIVHTGEGNDAVVILSMI